MRRKKDWKRVPENIIEIEGEDGKYFYFKVVRGMPFIRHHGEWWTPAKQFLKYYNNIKLPDKLITLLNLYYVLNKYDLKE